MLLDCPHCFRRVNTGDGSVCPNCDADVNDISSVDTTKSPLLIKHGASMPDVCCDCGAATDGFQNVVEKGTVLVDGNSEGVNGGMNSFLIAMVFRMLFGWIGWLALFLRRGSDGRPSHSALRMKFKIPQCDLCAEHKIKPISVDFERGTIRVVCNNQFNALYEKLNDDVPSFLSGPG